MTATKTMSQWRIFLLSLSHVADDVYQGAVPAMLPFFVAERHYGYVAAAGITLAATLLSSIVQPVFGLLTDKKPMPWMVPVGLTTAGIGIGFSGLVDSYLWTWCAIAVSGLGVAAYHPESARLARAASGGSHVGMSWYSLGGNVGFALGPVLVLPVVGAFGLGASLWLMIPALLVGALLSWMLKKLSTQAALMGSAAARVLKDSWSQFSVLVTVVILRSIANFALNTFLALWVIEHLDTDETTGAIALMIFFGAGAVGTLLGGYMARRWERVAVIRWSFLGTVPALLGVILLPGVSVYIFIVLLGVVLYIPFSLNVTLGQDYLPNRIGTASGVTLGLAVSVGGVAAPLIGLIGETWNLQVALLVVLVFPAASWIVSFWLKEPAQVTSATQTES